MCDPIQRGNPEACLKWDHDLSSKYWCDYNCIATIEEVINTNDKGLLMFDEANMEHMQKSTTSFLKSYTSSYDFTDERISSRHNSFQDNIINLCMSIDGVCQPFLETYCKNYTRRDVSRDITLRSMCGCYVTPDPIDLKQTNNPACDSLCRRGDVVQQVDIDRFGTHTKSCSEEVCVINDTHISDTSTPINLTSYCPNCDGNCYCVISGENIEQTLSSVGITNINFNQFCGSDSVCTIVDPVTQTTTSRPCDVGNLQPQTFSYLPSIYLVLFFVAIVVLVVIAVLLKSSE